MTFSKPWAIFPSENGGEERRPVLDVALRNADGGITRQMFVVDSGADLSMAPRALCAQLGLAWDAGSAVQLRGISPREECAVSARIHQVQILIREASCQITVPFCLAEGDAPLLLGREGFFDAFRIQFDKRQYVTTFELLNH